MSFTNIDLDAAVKMGKLFYYDDKFVEIEKAPGSQKPRFIPADEDEVDIMTEPEFDAYMAAYQAFHARYWPGSTNQIPHHKTALQRQRERDLERKESYQFLAANI